MGSCGAARISLAPGEGREGSIVNLEPRRDASSGSPIPTAGRGRGGPAPTSAARSRGRRPSSARATAARSTRAGSTSPTASSSTSRTSRVSFDGFKALNKPVARDRRGRAALRHRPQRRRQDHDDGRDHRQDAARRGHARSSARPSTSRISPRPQIAHAGIGRKFQKPTVFEHHSVFENLELAMKTDKRVRRTLFAKLASEQRDRIADDARARSASQTSADRAGGPALARPEAVARDRHAADAGAAAAAARRAGGRHDRRGDRAHRRAVPVARRASTRWWWSSTTWSSSRSIARKVTVLHEGSVLAEGHAWTTGAERSARVIEVYLGR